jgi:predicted nucleic acid-binding protein
MKVIADTSVWHRALLRKKQAPSSHVETLHTVLNGSGSVFMVGVILQEILQGIKCPNQCNEVYDQLSYLPRIDATNDDHAFAAHIAAKCRAKGIKTSTINYLIASLAIRHECRLLTADGDFTHVAKHTDLILL